MASPTANSMRLLRAEGLTVTVVERRLANVKRADGGMGISVDAFGFADLLGMAPRLGIMLVQTTSLANLPARVKKARCAPALGIWLRSGGRFELHGWIKKAGRWQCKRIVIDNPDELTPIVRVNPKRKRPASRWRSIDLFPEES